MVEFEFVGPTPRNEPARSGVRLPGWDGPGFRAIRLLAVEQYELP